MLSMEFVWSDALFSVRNRALGATEKLVQPLERAMLEQLVPTVAPKLQERVSNEPGIPIDIFRQVQLRTATVIAATAVPKSNKLLRLQVDLGNEKRQIIAGIAPYYTPETIIGKQVVVVANLQSAKLFGELSQGMVLAAKNDDGSLTIVAPEKPVAPGATVA